MIPGRIIRINDKVILKLWPRLEGQVIKSTPLFSLKLKPMTVSPYYPNLHPNELEPAMQQVVITISPLAKATKDDEEDYQDDEDDEEDNLSTSCDSSEDQDDSSWECPHPTRDLPCSEAGSEDIKDSDYSTTAEVGRMRTRED
ncbi:uncharacterized protein BJ212DRAFT_1294451 [Suillus subaureus]|uniref:Uncharacterized protein n=1 Tax=Suillus subaureus TaxID=48587 RepID=A0A9P7EPF4_9AGAM|nr:uncharacterized protein BJ212DRAFT_1294451 [Suillus subaureus]KAG1827087.1 hypothetical protein BJ212DRAFT_1294451 [Suillus subaureus]